MFFPEKNECLIGEFQLAMGNGRDFTFKLVLS